MSEWISVKDRLPKRDANVMCITPTRWIHIGRYQGDKFENAIFFRRWGYDKKIGAERYIPTEVTHWMPLPEPPKETEERKEE